MLHFVTLGPDHTNQLDGGGMEERLVIDQNATQQVNTRRVVEIIKMINRDKRTTAPKMAEALGTSVPTIRRTIRKARDILGVDIRWQPSPLVDDPGWYEIHNYGILDATVLDLPPLDNKPAIG